jgi:hypothetical protein
MDATMIPHVLSKLDQIREHQVKEGEALRDIRELLKQPLSAPPTSAPLVSSHSPGRTIAALDWLLSTNSLTWLLRTFWRFLPTAATLVYLKATGQSDKIIAYLNTFVGL